ncbi:MAG: 50S ribosomal protein L23 [Candidatus Paceibacterota bacterium]|jgi:large subunit ribosomal protein L23
MAIAQKKKISNNISNRRSAIKKADKPVESAKANQPHFAHSSVGLVIRPMVTEKSRDLAVKENKYVFLVKNNANKNETKKAIENLYRVEVIGVNIINVKPKPKRFGRNLGKTQQFKKAIVAIKKGQVIDVIPT